MSVENEGPTVWRGWEDPLQIEKPIHPKDVGSIALSALDEWIKSHEKTDIKVLKNIQNKISKISHQEFLEALNETIEKFNAQFSGAQAKENQRKGGASTGSKNSHKKEKQKVTEEVETTFSSGGGKPEFAVFVQPNKSQKWVAELAYERGLRSSTYLSIGEEAANELEASIYQWQEGTSKEHQPLYQHYVMIDDGTYTGNQMSNNISQANKILKGMGVEQPIFYILIPFVTETAIEKLKTLNGEVKYQLFYSRVMNTVDKLFQGKELDSIENIFWKALDPDQKKQRSKSTALHWFDHKIPNSMSFPEVIEKGLIEGKDPIRFLPEVNPPYKK